MRADEEIVAAEFKINLLRPAVGRLLVAEAVVLRLGRALVVSQATVRAVDGDSSKTVAVMLQTNVRVAANR
jgi:acyl-coenzyme A thioesterase PaaI-like protein